MLRNDCAAAEHPLGTAWFTPHSHAVPWEVLGHASYTREHFCRRLPRRRCIGTTSGGAYTLIFPIK
jgi:hypothetical protein